MAKSVRPMSNIESTPSHSKVQAVQQGSVSQQQPALPRSLYRFTSLETKEIRLPFVRYLPGRDYPHYWQPAEPKDYAEASRLGRQYAAHLAQWLKTNSPDAGHGLLLRIARDMDHGDRSYRNGLRRGFFNYLEVLLVVAGRQLNLFRHVEAMHQLQRSRDLLSWLENKRQL